MRRAGRGECTLALSSLSSLPFTVMPLHKTPFVRSNSRLFFAAVHADVAQPVVQLRQLSERDADFVLLRDPDQLGEHHPGWYGCDGDRSSAGEFGQSACLNPNDACSRCTVLID